MKTKRLSITMVAALAASLASASEMREMANVFADCAGVYQAASVLMKDGGRESIAVVYGNVGNGARISAAYALSLEYHAEHNRQKPLGDFLPYVDSRSNASKNGMSALIEADLMAEFASKLEKCASFGELQEMIVQQMREDIYLSGD